MACDAAWASQRWGHDAGGYRFDVLAAVVRKRVEAAGPPAHGGAQATRDVYRLGSGAVALGIQQSRLVSGRPLEGGGPASLQQEIEACVPRSLAGLSAAQMKGTFRAVVLFGCIEFDLVSSWLFCAKELAASLGVSAPTLRRVAVDGLTPEGEPNHAAQRRRLAEDATQMGRDDGSLVQQRVDEPAAQTPPLSREYRSLEQLRRAAHSSPDALDELVGRLWIGHLHDHTWGSSSTAQGQGANASSMDADERRAEAESWLRKVTKGQWLEAAAGENPAAHYAVSTQALCRCL